MDNYNETIVTLHEAVKRQRVNRMLVIGTLNSNRYRKQHTMVYLWCWRLAAGIGLCCITQSLYDASCLAGWMARYCYSSSGQHVRMNACRQPIRRPTYVGCTPAFRHCYQMEKRVRPRCWLISECKSAHSRIRSSPYLAGGQRSPHPMGKRFSDCISYYSTSTIWPVVRKNVLRLSHYELSNGTSHKSLCKV